MAHNGYICWMNKCIGHNTMWHVTTSGGQQSEDSRCHGRTDEVPFHAQVIHCCLKESFLHYPTCPSSEQPPFPLVWEQDLDQEQTPFSFSRHREYNIWGIVYLKLFYFSFLFPKCCQPKYIKLLFGPFQTYSVILKMCNRHCWDL